MRKGKRTVRQELTTSEHGILRTALDVYTRALQGKYPGLSIAGNPHTANDLLKKITTSDKVTLDILD